MVSPRQGHACCGTCLQKIRDAARASGKEALCPVCRGSDVVKGGKTVASIDLRNVVAQLTVRCLACKTVVRCQAAGEHHDERCPLTVRECPTHCGWKGAVALLAGHMPECRMLPALCVDGCGHLVRPMMAPAHAAFCEALQRKAHQV